MFTRGSHRHKVVVGKDTRLSGYMIEPALTAGFTGAGMDVTLVGPLPTPAIAMLTRSMRCDLGVMISASHNPYEDNGIKLFGPDGFKLSDDAEEAIESMLEDDLPLAAAEEVGRARRIDDAQAVQARPAREAGLRRLDVAARGVIEPRGAAEPMGFGETVRHISEAATMTSIMLQMAK